MTDLIKYNTREHKDILKVFSHTTQIEKKVMMSVAYELNKLDIENYNANTLVQIEIPIKKLTNLTHTNYESIDRICDKLTSKKIKAKISYKLKNGETEVFNMTEVCFPGAGISDNVFQIKVNGALLPLFSRALERYRHYNIIEAKFLTHKHSIEIYKYLKDKVNQDIKKFKISVDEFKNDIGLADTYNAYKNFKMRVLEPTLTDLKEHSVLYFDYTEIKKNRAVSELEFTIIESDGLKKELAFEKLVDKQFTEAKAKMTTMQQCKEFYKTYDIEKFYETIKEIRDRDKLFLTDYNKIRILKFNDILVNKKTYAEIDEKILLLIYNSLNPPAQPDLF